MKGSEIRQRFIEYFEKRGHRPVHSSPLLPSNDPTLLFVNAGMNQFKDVFLGNEKREYTRAVSSQKCIRAGGKHNDLDEVGKTARHHTFFEMLGNFSFGDYFKEEAINFAWDFLVNELGLEEERLWFSVFEGDDEVPADTEAEGFWKKAGAKPERILRFGRKDNFWQMGDTGPCGPSSEIHYYGGDGPNDPEKNRPDLVNNEEGDTTMEIWNLVFMQFDRSKDGNGGYNLTNLPAPSVDTGMGFERFTAVLQGVDNVYDTDIIRPIVDFVVKLSGKNYSYDSQEGFAMRVIADHSRAAAFAIADGILPGSEGRNYVLRKIMRRAIYHGREHLGFEGLFFNKVCNFVVEHMREVFPELESQKEFIGKMVRLEEERFGNTLTVGLKKLNEILSEFESNPTKPIFDLQKELEVLPDLEQFKGFLKNPDKIVEMFDDPELAKTFGSALPEELSEKLGGQEGFIKTVKEILQNEDYTKGALEMVESPPAGLISDLVRLYDTYGVPRDLIRLKLEEVTKIQYREDYFNTHFDDALKKLQSQENIGETQQAEKINPVYKALERQGINSNFRGYETTEVEDANVLAIVRGDDRVEQLSEGEEGLIVLDETPFYAEAGGQVGDKGRLIGVSSPSVSAGSSEGALPDGRATDTIVLDTFAPIPGITLHKLKVKSGSIKVGDTVIANVDTPKRDATRRNHTATHLVHAALKEVLGTHVKQAGSVVAPDYLRFDFTHYQAMSDMELEEIEDLVNGVILANETVNTDLMSIEEAMSSGAVAMFGEKYGSEVRVLSVGGGEFSKELCGGTHVSATGDIGSFKITSDEAIASGVRRIRAITGFDAFKRFREDEVLIDESLSVLNAQRDNMPNAIAKLQDELKQKRKEVDELKLKIASGAIGASSDNGDEARDVSGIKVMAKSVEDLDKGGMRHLSDTMMAKVKSGVVIIGNKGDGKVSFVVRVSEDLTDKIKAGSIIKEIAPIVGGRGGGKPDMAEGGGTEPEKLGEAIDASYGIVEKMLGGK